MITVMMIIVVMMYNDDDDGAILLHCMEWIGPRAVVLCRLTLSPHEWVMSRNLLNHIILCSVVAVLFYIKVMSFVYLLINYL